MMNETELTAKTRGTERQIALLFSEETPFSAHLLRWEDPLLPDKYDQNCFCYTGQPDEAELAAAAAFQKRRGAGFLKLEGDVPLQKRDGLEESVTLTMTLFGPCDGWKRNSAVTIRGPALPELEELEVRAFGKSWGEDFCRRNIRRMFEKLTYHGAYLSGALAGACFSFTKDGCTCIDGLVVDERFRRQYVATTLLHAVAAAHAGELVFLHADEDDTPKDLYARLGFQATDRLYEYLCTDLGALNLSFP